MAGFLLHLLSRSRDPLPQHCSRIIVFTHPREGIDEPYAVVNDDALSIEGVLHHVGMSLLMPLVSKVLVALDVQEVTSPTAS
jgi:hypothetical protein